MFSMCALCPWLVAGRAQDEPSTNRPTISGYILNSGDNFSFNAAHPRGLAAKASASSRVVTNPFLPKSNSNAAETSWCWRCRVSVVHKVTIVLMDG